MPSFNINTDAAVKFTNKLEKMKRSDLPVAVRNTLNNAARDMKMKSIPAVTSKEFTNRQKNFFRAFSGFKTAQGFDIKTMNSKVGIFPKGNNSAENLDAQEFGGEVKGRSFIPTTKARTSGSYGKKISRKNQLKNLQNVKRINKGNKKAFSKAAYSMKKGDVLIYGKAVLMIKKIKKREITTDLIYTYQKGRSAKISKPTGFMRKAALISSSKMVHLFKAEAERRIKRSLR